MQEITLMDKYPVFAKEILKSQTNIENKDEFIEILKQKIDNDKVANFISIFDNFSHTQSLGGKIAEGMIDGKIIVYCFGQEIPNPLVLSVRPRSIGIAEFEDKFVVSFLEAPKDSVNDKQIEWILEQIKD